MRTSAAGVAEIMGHEGIVPFRHKDSVNVDTFGVGHTASAGPPDPRAMAFGEEHRLTEVVRVFRADLRRFEKRVDKAVTVPLARHEFDALVSFDFNTGGIHKAKLTAALNAGNRPAAASGFMGWVRPPEIRGRRQREQALFRDGVYAHGGKATLYPADGQGRVLWARGRRIDVRAAAEAVVAANAEDERADGARQTTVATGGTAGVNAVASGPAADAAGNADGGVLAAGDLRLVFILLAVFLAAAAGLAAWRWWKHRQEAQRLAAVAARELGMARVNAEPAPTED